LLVANTSVRGDLQAKFAGSDLVQETFLEASQIFDRFTGNSEQELLRWLTRILENKLGNALKRHVWAAKRDVSREHAVGHSAGSAVFGPSPGLTPSGVISVKEEGKRIRAAILQLSDDYRLVVELRVHRGLSFDEIGREMNRTSEAARKLFARAIDELRFQICDHDTSTGSH